MDLRGIHGHRHRRLGRTDSVYPSPPARGPTRRLCADRPLQRLFEHVDAKPGQYTEKDISLYHWHNGIYPETAEYNALYQNHFADYRSQVGGLVAHPIGLVQLRALPQHTQVSQVNQHFCIQGWCGVAKWSGVSMTTILELVHPQPSARWVVFYSFGDGSDGGVYYDVHPVEQMNYQLTMLAYDMNDKPLDYGHGAPSACATRSNSASNK